MVSLARNSINALCSLRKCCGWQCLDSTEHVMGPPLGLWTRLTSMSFINSLWSLWKSGCRLKDIIKLFTLWIAATAFSVKLRCFPEYFHNYQSILNYREAWCIQEKKLFQVSMMPYVATRSQWQYNIISFQYVMKAKQSYWMILTKQKPMIWWKGMIILNMLHTNQINNNWHQTIILFKSLSPSHSTTMCMENIEIYLQ